MPAVRLILGGDHARFLDTVEMGVLPEVGGRLALDQGGTPIDLEVVAVEAMQSGSELFGASEPFAICRRIFEPHH
ncbi:hypothetical protein [Sphingomonas sp. AX6]|uniref:hypothetical protein n=1 Tax=Sphingomonas sp. AX6 TaxID=2653171 RepID=UPI0012EF4C3A|nr:hypothetical protein [Sphingomonas sp. AX6]VXC90989.1 hypothetical protein SPHINGOAX6_70259 [Sphingomonas sp. AX6]